MDLWILRIGQVCYARNVHARSREDIAEMAAAWEDCPPLYTLLDVSRLMATSDVTVEVRLNYCPPLPSFVVKMKTCASCSDGMWQCSCQLEWTNLQIDRGFSCLKVKASGSIREVDMEAGSDDDEAAEAPLDEGSEGLQLFRSNRWVYL